MTEEELEKKAEEYQTGRKDLNYFSEPYKDKIRKAYIAGAKEMQKEIIEIEKVSDERWEENQQLKQQLKNEKQLNAEIKKRFVEVEYDCEEFNHEYCDINCKGKRKELVDLYQLILDGLNETLLKQKEDEIKELKEVIKNLGMLRKHY